MLLPEASVDSNIPTNMTKGEQNPCYMAEHVTIDLLYHYHMKNITDPFIMECIRLCHNNN